MNRVLARPSVVASENSVTGPYRPRNNVVPFRPGWSNSDSPLAPQSLRQQQILPMTAQPMLQPRPQPPRPQADKPKIGRFRKAIALTGAFLSSVGTVAGFISIAALGPVGLAVAAGSFLLGCVLIRASVKE